LWAIFPRAAVAKRIIQQVRLLKAMMDRLRLIVVQDSFPREPLLDLLVASLKGFRL
jgi:hypothetical protein